MCAPGEYVRAGMPALLQPLQILGCLSLLAALACMALCLQVYPAVKFDASKLIELLKPIRQGSWVWLSGVGCPGL